MFKPEERILLVDDKVPLAAEEQWAAAAVEPIVFVALLSRWLL